MIAEVFLSSEEFAIIGTVNQSFYVLSQPSYTYVYTPNSSPVLVFDSDSLTSAEVTASNNYFINTYPNATFVSDASGDYNCHSYAWYSSSTSNIWWMNKDYLPYSYPGVKTYMNDGSYSRVYSAYQATRVFFDTEDHSMKIYDAYSNSIYNATLISKWGPGPVMIHTLTYSPYDYSGYKMYS
ncbi:MAG: hypothetical protein ABH890_03945 [Bacillota bacterium]